MATTKTRGASWKSIEDECLCRAYVQIYEDGIVGNGQTNLTFWQRVRIRFHEQLTGANRTQESMESRMRTISKSCSAWKGALRKATSRQGSGTTQSDVDRAKARAEYEGERLELQRRKGKREDEQWEYTKKEKERDAERWDLEKREKEAALMRQNMDILEKDLSKLTPRKKKYWRGQ
ncbi:hypothetical protein LINPERHAP1_LOCUS38931 [Linum perenne]